MRESLQEYHQRERRKGRWRGDRRRREKGEEKKQQHQLTSMGINPPGLL